ncbi:PilZ domain-containing protein [Methylobacterium sp. 37f]|uniref:PilZ domain-containing protein n=1 Tax=Methylobacterium sp. 37f TaxID=2817058 RepID=UPI001FFD41D3|nr:PilZ domain-containing protein [Methylobacterium sp. 37f]MCK2052865.1 PilZ domain-containing protein [Methylobacterium sp. 37f]
MTQDQDAALHEDRASRSKTEWIGLIRTQEGTEIPCSVKDVSATGAKLSVSENIQLPYEFMLKVVGMDYVCAVALAWRVGNLVGVRIVKFAKLVPKRVLPADSHEATDWAPHQRHGTRRHRRLD